MRILVVSNLFPPAVVGGYEVECATVVAHLRARAHRVLVLTSARGRAPGEHDVLRVLPWLTPDARGALRAPAAGVRAARAARRVAAAFDPELVYVWNGADVPHAALRVLDGLDVPVAVRVCEHWFTRLYRGDQLMRHLVPGERGLRGAWARGVRALNRLHPDLRLDPGRAAPVAVSWVSAALRARSPAPPGVRVTHEEVLLPATAGLERFAGVGRVPEGDEPPLLLFAGRLDPRKGPEVAVRALAELERAHGVRARLVLAGPEVDGMGGRLAALGARLGVGGRLELPGRLEVAELAGLAARARVWLVPSVWEEPAGMGGLEAALAGVPVVAARIGGIPEVVGDEDHGLLFAPGDAADCARQVARTLADPAAAARRAAAARARAQGLRLGPYLARTEAFLAAAVAAHPR